MYLRVGERTMSKEINNGIDDDIDTNTDDINISDDKNVSDDNDI